MEEKRASHEFKIYMDFQIPCIFLKEKKHRSFPFRDGTYKDLEGDWGGVKGAIS